MAYGHRKVFGWVSDHLVILILITSISVNCMIVIGLSRVNLNTTFPEYQVYAVMQLLYLYIKFVCVTDISDKCQLHPTAGVKTQKLRHPSLPVNLTVTGLASEVLVSCGYFIPHWHLKF